MIQLINKMKKNQKGFTLVELIVVLVILAILAAFTIPAMLGFINDARGKAYIAEARSVYMAYQGATSEFPSLVEDTPKTYNQPGTSGDVAGTADKIQISALAKLDTDLITATTAGTTTTYKLSDTNADTQWRVSVLNGKVTNVQFLKNSYKITIAYNTTGSSGEAVIEKGGKIT